MIQKTVKLHFTIGVLRLFSSKEVDDARTALAKFAPQIPYILHGQPLKVRVNRTDVLLTLELKLKLVCWPVTIPSKLVDSLRRVS